MPLDLQPIKKELDLQPIENKKLDLQPIGASSTSTLDLQPINTSKKPSFLESIGKFASGGIFEPLKHPERVIQPVTKSLGGKTIEEKYQEKIVPKILEGINPKSKIPLGINPRVLLATVGGIGANIADMAQTPLSYIPLPIGKVVGKIPVRGTTLGEIASKLPFKDILKKDVAERVGYQTALENLPVRVAESQAPLQKVAEVVTPNPVNKIIQALQEAKPIRGQQETLYSAERSKRLGAVVEAGKVGGEAGYQAQLGALKGELPKVQFEGIRGKITQPDIDSLFNTIEQHPILSPFEKVTTKTGLSKLLGAEGGTVPTKNELKLLGEVFPQNFIQTVLDKRSVLTKVGEGIAEVLNVPRALMASADMSAPLRQGVFLIGRPKQFLSAFRDMFKYFFNEKSYQGLMSDIQKRPTYALMRESRLPLTDIGSILTNREETFMSNLAEKIPGVGHIVRASNRAYTGFLNKLRADVFDDLVNTAQKQGIKVEGKTLNDISRFIGSATGRGQIGALENSAVALNSVFFSPRLMASRLNLLNPVYYTKLDPFVRKEALKSLFTFAGTATSILGLAKLGGAEVGVDPRSADFLKMKWGDTRYDIGGGFQQYLRAAGQLITGEYVNSTTGVKATLGEGYKPLTRFDILTRLIESKEAPIASFATMLLKGQTSLGKKPEIGKEVAQRFIPMVIQDAYDLIQERGLKGLGMSIPGVFGVGLQTYSPTAQEMVSSANSVLNNYRELLKQGRVDEARNLLDKNKDIIRMGKILEPNQKVISSYEKLQDTTKKNIRLSPEQKQQKLNEYGQKIKDFQSRIETRYKTIKGVKPKMTLDLQPVQ